MLPGRLVLGEGVYVSSGSEQLATESEYLVVQPNCSCSFFKPSLNHTGLVQTPDFFAHGRVLLADGKIALSRVATVPTIGAEWFIDESGKEVQNAQASEVLVCQSLSPPTAVPVLAFKSKSCGVWSSAKDANPKFIRSLGFNAGTSTNNTIAWIGRGSFNGELQVGRYQSETGTTYVANEQPAVASEFLVVPDGCSCEFVEPKEANTRNGIVTAPGQVAFGRVVLANGQVVISRVNMSVDGNFTQRYATLLNATTSDANTKEVLVCETRFAFLHPCGE
jgi:hypothetical protein